MADAIFIQRLGWVQNRFFAGPVIILSLKVIWVIAKTGYYEFKHYVGIPSHLNCTFEEKNISTKL